jgi:hypothetical protein
LTLRKKTVSFRPCLWGRVVPATSGNEPLTGLTLNEVRRLHAILSRLAEILSGLAAPERLLTGTQPQYRPGPARIRRGVTRVFGNIAVPRSLLRSGRRIRGFLVVAAE